MKIRELFAAVGFDIDYDALRKLNGELDAVKGLTNEVFGNLRKISDGIRNVGLGLTAGITLPMGALAVSSSKAYAGLEQINVFYETLIGNADEAKTLMGDLLNFEAKTPFTLDQVLQYSQKLLMMKIPLEEITDTLRMVGEAAGGRVQYIGGILEQLHQVKNLGYASMMDIRPLSNQGVPIIEALAKVMNTSKAGVMEAVSNRGITYEILMNAIRSIADEREGLLEKQSKTLGGLWATLMSRWYMFRTEIGKIIVESLKLKDVLQFVIDKLSTMVKIFKELPKALQGAIFVFGIFITLLGPALVMLGMFLNTAVSIMALKFGLSMFGVSLGMIAAKVGPLILLFTKWIAIIALVYLALDDLYNWIKGNDSLTGVLLGPWQKWYEDVKSFIDDIWRKLEAIYRVFTDPFSADTWKNFKYEAVHSFKTAFPEWHPSEYDFSGVNFNPSSSAKSSSGNYNTAKIENNLTISVPPGTTEEQVRFIERTVNDTVNQNLNEQLNKLFVGNDG